MVKTGFTAAALVLCSTLGFSGHAQVIKCTDSSGHVTFSDRMCNHGTNEIAHRGYTDREFYEQEQNRQQALSRKAASSYRRSVIEAEQAAANSYSDTSSYSDPAEQTGPGKRKTISTLLPDGAGFAQKEAAQQKRSSQRRAQIRSEPTPMNMNRCEGGFCYDNQSRPYHQIGGGMMTAPSGRICHTVGNMVHCN